MRVGFTGTRSGMTPEQMQALRKLLLSYDYLEFHHGDCIGADDEAHAIVTAGHDHVTTIIHPPIDDSKRAWCVGDIVKPPKTYFARNRDIVQATDITIGTPFGPKGVPAGGTWYTLDYSVKTKHATIIIWPNGDVILL